MISKAIVDVWIFNILDHNFFFIFLVFRGYPFYCEGRPNAKLDSVIDLFQFFLTLFQRIIFAKSNLCSVVIWIIIRYSSFSTQIYKKRLM